MDVGTIIDIGTNALYTTLLVAAPMLGVALVIGVAVSLVQALTQVQEMTLTFVPKVAAMFVTAVIAMPFMAGLLIDLGQEMFLLAATVR